MHDDRVPADLQVHDQARRAVGFRGSGVQRFKGSGVHRTARIFNGTASSWCAARGWTPASCADYWGVYVNDKLVMKWNAELDRGNAEDWANPPYRAWEDNEWNGKCAGCSGSVWHYKTQWVGACGANYTPLPDGGYCIWGVFETIMDRDRTRTSALATSGTPKRSRTASEAERVYAVQKKGGSERTRLNL